MNEYLIAIIIVVVIFGIAIFITSRNNSKREQYAKGFKYGKIEHKAETWATRLLVIGSLILALHIWWLDYNGLNTLLSGYSVWL